MRKYLILLLALALSGLHLNARHYDRGYETVPSSPFIEKGTWLLGGYKFFWIQYFG